VHLFLRNASQLPVEIVQLAYDVHTAWRIRSGERSYRRIAGVQPQRFFVYDPISVPSQETWASSLSCQPGAPRPEGAAQLDLNEGVRCVIVWLFLVDNAGRMGIAAGQGTRAKRVRRYSRRRETNHRGGIAPARWIAPRRTGQARRYEWARRGRWPGAGRVVSVAPLGPGGGPGSPGRKDPNRQGG
jgi:hypothetical protein